MDVSCGNCATATDETRTHVMCKPDLLPAVWHQKTEVCKGCRYFRPKYAEVRLAVVELTAEYYVRGSANPIAVVVRSADGRRFLAGKERISQVRYHGWTKRDSFYEEDEIRYRRERWIADGDGPGVEMILSTREEIGCK